MIRLRLLLFLVILSGLLFGHVVIAFAEAHRERPAHEHGAVTLDFVIEGSKAELQIEAPAHDIVGFEHSANEDADKKTAHQKYRLLGEVNSVVRLSAEAECTQTGVEISGQVFSSVEKSSGELRKHDKHSEHSEVKVVYELSCKKPQNLKEIKILLFEHFPEIKKIKTQVIKDEKQFGGLVTGKSPYIPGFLNE